MTQSETMFFYPIFLNLQGRQAVVVGAGNVGRRKIEGLLQVGARVRVIDPQPVPDQLEDRVELLPRTFAEGDLAGAFLVFACTDSEKVNHLVAATAQQQGVLCCRTDRPGESDFALPALFRQGPLTVAVSTGGGSPALAAEIRDHLAQQVPDCWGDSLELMAAIRRKWLTLSDRAQYNQRVLRSFWADRLLPLMEQKNSSEINQLLIETFGNEFSLEQLQVQLPEGTS